MKFGKEFKRQKVPEWTEAYVDYNGLKRILQNVHSLRQSKQPATPLRNLQQKSTLCRTFSGLAVPTNDVQSTGDVEDQVIAVNTVQQQNSTRRLYNTRFLMSPEEGAESEIMFFEKLDEELNKVNSFYKDKVEEVKEEAALLNKQMDALIALRIKVINPNVLGSESSSRPPKAEMKQQHLAGEVNNCLQREENTAHIDDSVHPVDPSADLIEIATSNDHTMVPLNILDRVKITNTFESPISTIRGVLNDSREKELKFKKEEVKEVEARLKHVFVEFYRKLHLLKQYSFMNLSAFSKILKKYEKITSRNAARSYLKIVDNSYLGSCDEVISLMDRVEATFIKHFSCCNRREGMKILRPKQKKEKQWVTFFSGFLSGCSIALVVAVILLLSDKGLIGKDQETSFLDHIFPLYSFYAYIVLHLLLYALDIYLWKHYRINYPFIFGFKHGSELSYSEVFLFSTGLAMLALATFLLHLHMKMDSSSQEFETYVEFIPLALITVILIIIVCPFNVMYRSSRLFLVKSLFRCICAPLYKVTLPDFFLADQLTSQIQAIRSFEYYICYYGWVKLSWRQNKCHDQSVYNVFYYIVAVIPYWFRFLQCVRRLFEEKDFVHALNGLRYFLTIVAVVIRTAFELRKNLTWKVMASISSAIATLMNTYWDIVVDWGLLQRTSKNLFLRDKLIISHKSVYFLAMILDVVLRFAWLQLVLKFNVPSLRGDAVSSTFSCLEVIRRGIWNFFRLENEHLNNVGKYRAFKSVPLPFSYDDDTDTDKEA